MAVVRWDQSGAAGHALQAAVVGVIAQVGGHRQDIEDAWEVFGTVVDEDGVVRVESQVRRQIAAVAVAALLGETTADEVVQPEFLGAGPGVGLAAGAPQDDVAALSGQVLQDIARSGPERGPGQRVDQAAVHVEDPGVDDNGCERLDGRIIAGQAIGRHYWYTLFAMQHAWDRRLGFWYLAEEYPDQPAVVACPSGVTLTFAELAGRAHQLVHGLRARGLRAGDILAYALPNDVDMLCWQLAAQEGGFASIGLNPALSGGEVQRIVDHSEAVALVLHHDFAERVDQMSGSGSIALRVSVGGDIPGFTSEADLISGQPMTEPDDRVLGLPINYSSGTTGQPKAVIRPGSRKVNPSVAADGAKSFGHAFQFQPLTGVHLISAGMHHGGCQGFYLGALNVGQAVAILGKFDPEQTLDFIARYRVTTAYMVPTQFVRLLRLPQEVKDGYDVSSLEVVVHSAAPCPAGSQEADDGVVGPCHLGDVRRHGRRGDHRQALPLAGEARHRRADPSPA